MSNTDAPRPAGLLEEELRNFQEIARCLKPSSGEVPVLTGIEIASLSVPLRDVVGGDHTIYVDFKKRFDLPARIAGAERDGRGEVADNLRRQEHRAGILLADVSGHRITDALVAAMLHQAFLVGVLYELDRFGQITTKVFEHLNTRFYKTTGVSKYFTMIYGEIEASGRFRFVSAGHPPPRVFSREFGRFMPISPDRLVSFPPVGMFPSSAAPDQERSPSVHGYKERYRVNEIELLCPGDILLLHTDGLAEHDGGRFFPEEVERALAGMRGTPADEVCARLRERLLAAGEPVDDVSLVVIRRN